MKVFVVFMVFMLMSGCAVKQKHPSYRLGQFTVASSHNVRNLNYSIGANTKTSVVGEDCYNLEENEKPNDARLQRAMDNAIADGQNKGIDGDLLVNVRIDEVVKDKPTGFLGFGERHNCMVVTGDLVAIESKGPETQEKTVE